MKIELWSDYICPYCYKGKRVLEAALQKFSHRDEVEIIYRSYILSPDAKKENRQLVTDMLIEKYGQTITEIENENQRLKKKASQLGLDYSKLNQLYDINTFDAHRIGIYAQSVNLSKEWTEALMNAHFTREMLIDEELVLLTLAKEIGLNPEMVQTILQSDLYSSDVRFDMEEADALGIETVPFFAFDRVYAISGVVSVTEFLEALTTAYNQKK
jgi:predicted DsbA family dithiol-disulfide isomerase